MNSAELLRRLYRERLKWRIMARGPEATWVVQGLEIALRIVHKAAKESRAKSRRKGFTLVELMIVVAIVGVLAAVTTPEYKRLYRQTSEGMTRGNLATLRSALSIYYSDNDGQYPTDNLACLLESQKYLQEIPLKRTPPYHGEGATVTGGGWADMDAAQGSWFYINDSQDTQFGRVVVNCVHQDLRGRVWSSY